jgi:sugar lactone lactonase YvrE
MIQTRYSRSTSRHSPALHFVLVLGALTALIGCTAKEAIMPAPHTPQAPLESILAPGTQVERVAAGFQFTEGPVWHPDGYLLFSDIPANTIYRWTPGETEATVYRKPSNHSNGLTLDAQGRLIACEHDRRLSRQETDGTITAIATHYQGGRLNSPNDVVVHSDGSIYFTDPPYGLPGQKEGKEQPWNGVYRLAADGTLTLLDDSFERPNGLAFSPDEKTLYVDDSYRDHIRAFDVLPDGTLANGRVFADLGDPGAGGVPDGMKVDVLGNVFCTGPGGIWVISPDGEQLGRIVVPQQPANLAWGDADYKTLYITARTGLYRVRTLTGGKPAGG